MKTDRQLVIYLLVLVLLLAGIILLWNKSNIASRVGQSLLDGANQLVSGKKIVKVENTDTSLIKTKGELRTYNGIEESNNNVVGFVKSWNPEQGVLTVVVGQKEADFVIDPIESRVMLSKAKNDGTDKSLTVINKFATPELWAKAFCIDDPVSLLIRPETNGVRVIIDSGIRMCGVEELK